MAEWVQIRIPEALYKEVQDAINREKFWINEHDFIRDAIREKLAQNIASEAHVKPVKEVAPNG
jgi:Arc/MetJ-type ribon-helix-helix transcriptional regulator